MYTVWKPFTRQERQAVLEHMRTQRQRQVALFEQTQRAREPHFCPLGAAIKALDEGDDHYGWPNPPDVVTQLVHSERIADDQIETMLRSAGLFMQRWDTNALTLSDLPRAMGVE